MFKQYILGGIEPGLFLSCIFFAAIGIFFILLVGTGLRDKNSINSPTNFSWKYLWSDNAKRIYASIIAVLITLRFMPDILNVQLDPFKALCVGMGWDSIILFIKQKTSILDPKK